MSYQIVTPIPVAPIISARIHLCFDCDFPMDSLNELIGLQAAEMKRQSKTRINPLTHKQNPGYWSYYTERVSSFDCAPFFSSLNRMLMAHAQGLRQAIEQHQPGEIYICIQVLVQQEDEYPSIRLSPQLLSTISSLNAFLDIIVENDYSTEDHALELNE